MKAAILRGLIALGICLSVWAPVKAEEKPRIAVLNFTLVGVDEMTGVFLVDKLRSDLVKTGRFTVLDRAQSDKIVDELARQQQGLTDEKTAIQIGKQFNVQRIVTGRIAAQAALGLIQVNAEMIDMQTAVILVSETIMHDGDMKGFILVRVPSLAALLAGLKSPQQAATAGAPAQAALPAGVPNTAAIAPGAGTARRRGAPVRIALFPALFLGQASGRLERSHGRVLDAMAARLENNPRWLIAHSFYRLGGGVDDRTMEDRFGYMDEAWSGFSTKVPNEVYGFRVGKDLGVDIVLMYSVEKDRGVPGNYRVFLLDVDKLRVHERSGNWDRRWGAALRKGIAGVLRAYYPTR
ncbi:MAG: CsgG/HfaB family protein [bacterium]